MNKITMLIVDDHKLIRDTWAIIFSKEERFEVLGQTGNLEEAVAITKNKRPDIVLLDINMRPVDGFEILKLIRKFSPLSKVIAVSMHLQPNYVRKMLKGGAIGYVSKGASVKELFEAIEEAIKGNSYLSEDIKEIIARQWSIDSPASGIESLSNRELQIIGLIRSGFSSKAIGEALHIEPKTVEVHRHNILKKLKVKNTAALIDFVSTHGL
jgi:DNA-binding NarL/FixJ family response regulator